MAEDIGVLNIRIRENSTQASTGIGFLADALERLDKQIGESKLGSVARALKNISGELERFSRTNDSFTKLTNALGDLANSANDSKLGGVSRALRKINEEINAFRVDGTIENLNGVAAALNRVKQASDFTVPSLRGLGRLTGRNGDAGAGTGFSDAVERTEETVQNATDGMEDGFTTVSDSIEQAREETQDFGNTVRQVVNDIDKIPESVIEANRALAMKYKGLSADQIRENNMQKAWRWFQIDQDPAIQEAHAKAYGLTRDEVMERFAPQADAMRQQIQEIMDTLNKPIDINWAESIERMQGIGAPFKDAAESARVFAENTTDAQRRVDELLNTLNQPININWADAINQMMGIGSAPKSAEESMSAFLDAMNDTSDLAMKLKADNPELTEFKQQMDDAGISAREFNSSLVDVDGELKSKKKDAGEATGAFDGLKHSFDGLKNVMKKLPFAQLAKQVANVARRMAIRAVIKSVTSAFQEGVQNVYEYSKAIGSGFASSIDNAKASLATMTNSLGAAVAPAIQALIPILQTVVSWVITAVNYLNQFFALITGHSSWTRAVDQGTAALDAQKKAAKGAGGAVKDLLASWDELNVIASDSGGGGGGGAAAAVTDYAGMFEEVYEFEDWIKNLVNWMKENLNEISGIVAGIVAALLGLPASVSIGIGLIVTGIKNAYDAGYDIGYNGFSKKAIINACKGVLETALGGALIGWYAAGASGALFGAYVGFTIGLMVLDYGIYTGKTASLYGSIEEDVETIKKNIKKYFTIDELEIEIIKARISNIRQAEEMVEDALEEMQVSYRLVLQNNTAENVKALYDKVVQVVKATKILIGLRKEQIVVGLEITTQFNGRAEDVISFSEDQWNAIDNYVGSLGERIGKILEDGVIDGVTEADLLNDLQGKLTRVTNAILAGERSGEFAGKVSVAGSDFRENLRNNVYTKGTVETYMSEYINQYKELNKLAEANAVETKKSLKSLAMAMEEAGAEAGFTAEQIKKAWDNYYAFDVTQDTKDKMRAWSAEGAAMFAEDIKGLFSMLLPQEFSTNMMKISMNSLTKTMADAIKHNDWNTVTMSFENGLNAAIAEATGIDKKTLVQIQDMLGITGWDLLTNEMKEDYFETLERSLNTQNAVRALYSTFHPDISEMIKVSGYNKFTTEQKVNFLYALSAAYGSRETILAAQAAGINVADAINAGLKSGDAGARTAAEELMQQIRDTLNASGVSVPVDATVDVLVNATVEVEAKSTTSKIQQIASQAAAVYTGAQAIISDVKNKVSSFFGNNKKKVGGAATGAYGIPSGELFMARENGITEYVGSIGGKASVANNEQIVDGISKGVADANQEQNALIRQQNELLRQQNATSRRIVEMLLSGVGVKSGSQFGRVIQQSLDAYNAQTGGY